MTISPMLAVIGGSVTSIPADFVQDGTGSAVNEWGQTSSVPRLGSIGALRVIWLARHGEPSAIAPHRVNYRANIAGIQAEGATHVLALNTVGGIHPDAAPGAIWVPDQIIDYSWGRESTFHDGERREVMHAEFAEPYSSSMRQLLIAAAADASVAVHDGGVYGCTQGPRLETAAEIRRMRTDGCDLVGMTGMPEAALAREAGLTYASLCLVVNRAAGLSPEPISLEQIIAEARACAGRVSLILQSLARLTI